MDFWVAWEQISGESGRYESLRCCTRLFGRERTAVDYPRTDRMRQNRSEGSHVRVTDRAHIRDFVGGTETIALRQSGKALPGWLENA